MWGSPLITRRGTAKQRVFCSKARPAYPPAVLFATQPLIETERLLDRLESEGMGAIAFSPLAQGMLTDKYLGGIPENSRASQGKSLDPALLKPETLARIAGLNEIAQARGQSLAQLAIAWVLRDPRITSALIGARRVAQLEDCVAALDNLSFSEGELAEIDRYAEESGLNLWARSAELDGADG